MRLTARVWIFGLLLLFLLASTGLPPGPLNAITDVEGVRAGHRTLVRGGSVRTGVTAILPHGGNLFQSKTPAAVYVGNGFGKAGHQGHTGEAIPVDQVRELLKEAGAVKK